MHLFFLILGRYSCLNPHCVVSLWDDELINDWTGSWRGLIAVQSRCLPGEGNKDR